MKETTSRRNILKTVAGLGTVSLAGCTEQVNEFISGSNSISAELREAEKESQGHLETMLTDHINNRYEKSFKFDSEKADVVISDDDAYIAEATATVIPGSGRYADLSELNQEETSRAENGFKYIAQLVAGPTAYPFTEHVEDGEDFCVVMEYPEGDGVKATLDMDAAADIYQEQEDRYSSFNLEDTDDINKALAPVWEEYQEQFDFDAYMDE